MLFLRSNTAVIIAVGPFYDRTDGVTIETALTITNERITLIAETDGGAAPTIILDNIAGATSATANDLNYITGQDNGMMQMELAAADVNRVGRMKLSITDAANHVPVFHELFVLPQAIYDWFTGVIVPLPANVTQLLGTAWLTPGTAGTPDVNTKLAGGTAWGSGAITAASIAADAITAAKVADGTIDAATFAADAITASKIAADVTTELQSGLATAANLAIVAGYIDTEVAAIKAVTDLLPNGGALSNLDAAISTRATPAQVNAEVLDVLNVDTYAEPGQAAPAATATLAAKINYLYKLLRNKITQTATTLSVYNDAGTVVDQKSTVSDDATTYTRGKLGTGP